MLLGDEAVAQGSLDSGLSGCYAYPGTPSTEIMEYIQKNPLAIERNVHRTWSANEKTAVEAAIGMSYGGKRAMACMKHVGLNVAADAFMNAAITGAHGGLVIVSADDPSMHSSQNEQDSRYYGKFAMVPVLEPSNQQEAYDITRYAFDLSEKYGTPVLLRLTTRLAHSRSAVVRKEPREENTRQLPENKIQFVLLPSNARVQYQKLLDKQTLFVDESENSGFNTYYEGKDKKLGIIACGIAYNYLIENFENHQCPHPVLKISQYPLPRKKIQKIVNECDEILVIEEGYPFVEEMLKGYLDTGKPVHGRLDGYLPRAGELNPSLVARALGLKVKEFLVPPSFIVGRLPKFCDGCAHADAYMALNMALEGYSKGRVMSDIGCYTLGAYKPYEAINSCVDMGASITMAKGLADAGEFPVVAVIGDSTFTHSGMTGLLDCVIDRSPVTIVILDNSTTGMTGGQPSHATNRLEQICLGLGVEKEHLITITPLKKYLEPNAKAIKKELEYKGVSVIIAQRECIQTATRRKKAEKSKKAILNN